MVDKVEKKDIKLQSVQTTIDRKPVSFDRQSMWYTDRPINAKTQTYNRYLDTAEIDTDWVLITSWGDALVTVIWYENKTGNPQINIVSWWFEIPSNGTYMIQGWVWIDTTATTVLTTLELDVEKNWVAIYDSYVIAAWLFSIIYINSVFNFKKWDLIQFRWYNTDTNDLLFIWKWLSLIKLS